MVAGSGILAATPATATEPAIAATVAGDPPAPGSAKALATPPEGKVVSRMTLSIREEPTSGSVYLGGLRPGTIIPLFCKVRGQNVDGNNLWYLLGDARPGYVAARYVENQSPVPYCER